jgi:hypothetical protein
VRRGRRKDMAIPRKNLRSMHDLQTMAGKCDKTSLPYRTFLRLGCLEMEKYRRGQERQSAMFRMMHIDKRFQEIELEKSALLQNLEKQKEGHPSKDPAEVGFELPSCPKSARIKLKY